MFKLNKQLNLKFRSKIKHEFTFQFQKTILCLTFYFLAVLTVSFFHFDKFNINTYAQNQNKRTAVDLKSGVSLNQHPISNLSFVFSVDYNTIGAAYKNTYYKEDQLYLGYWHSLSCYEYNGDLENGYFQPNGKTNQHYECNTSGTGNGFSGNFLNFIATSQIDIIRYALTGGDRIIDESSSNGKTILQRAILPNGTNESINPSFYANAHYFPTKIINYGALLNKVTPFIIEPNEKIYIQSCFNQLFFGKSPSGHCQNAKSNPIFNLKNAQGQTIKGIFQAKVLVCDQNEGKIRFDLCKQYPNGAYKPIGEIQKNHDKLRMALFSYVIDDNKSTNKNNNSNINQNQINSQLNRYGGVLYAPMKFVGSTQKNEYGLLINNPNAEWDENTGVFIEKPLDTTAESSSKKSGVINYINKLGYSNGLYKRFDPIGELFYENIRYFQGKQASSEAISQLNNANRDFPIYTKWDDPIQDSCQKNYSLVIGHDENNLDAFIPGSQIANQSRSIDGTGVGGLDSHFWTRVIEGFETNQKSGESSYMDALGHNQLTDGNPAKDNLFPATGINFENKNLASKLILKNTENDYNKTLSSSYLWAGVSYWANTQSIRADKPDIRVKTFVLDLTDFNNDDPVINRSSAFYLAGKYGGFWDLSKNGLNEASEGHPFKTWVSGELISSNQEWLVNDQFNLPKAYFLSQTPEKIISNTQKIFTFINQPNYSSNSAVQPNSSILNQNSPAIYYVTQINSNDGSGTIQRKDRLFNSEKSQLSTNAKTIWDAGKILTGYTSNQTVFPPKPEFNRRKIYTSTRLSGKQTNHGVPFLWDSIDQEFQELLKIDPITQEKQDETIGKHRLNYLRGDRSQEKLGLFKNRSSLIGDIVNSSLAISGKPNEKINDLDYLNFFKENKNRTPTVFVGSNNGMLHAFYAASDSNDSKNGEELFAYIPRVLAKKLNTLTHSSSKKESFVDGSIITTEAQFYQPSKRKSDWGSILISGMGAGEKGIFALDITKPSEFNEQNILWEFTNQDDEDMGHILGETKIVKLNTADEKSNSPHYKWFAAVSNGYNYYVFDKNSGAYSSSKSYLDKQYLFLLSLDKLPQEPWVLNQNYFKINADSSFPISLNEAKALSSIGFSVDLSGAASVLYAGDLQGNMWRFDLTGGTQKWPSLTASLFFVASSDAAGNNRQAITQSPLVRLSSKGGYLISFGTGKLIEPSDLLPNSAKQQSIYTVWDADLKSTVYRGNKGSINGLIARKSQSNSFNHRANLSIVGEPFYYGTKIGSTYRGWYFDFTSKMERAYSEITFDPSGIAVLTTKIPLVNQNRCSLADQGFIYIFNPNNGISYQTIDSDAYSDVSGLSNKPLITKLSSHLLSKSEILGLSTSNENNSLKKDSAGRFICQESFDILGILTKKERICGRINWREVQND